MSCVFFSGAEGENPTIYVIVCRDIKGGEVWAEPYANREHALSRIDEMARATLVDEGHDPERDLEALEEDGVLWWSGEWGADYFRLEDVAEADLQTTRLIIEPEEVQS